VHFSKHNRSRANAGATSFTRRLRHLAIALLVFAASGPLQAFDGAATDKAFVALLTTPGAGPEFGAWDFPGLDDFQPSNEQALIRYLARQRAAAADFNAHRHAGTLLHHAIRASQNQVALWLLENGADPRKKLQGGGADAMQLAVQYARAPIVAALERDFGMRRPVRAPEPAPPPALESISLDALLTRPQWSAYELAAARMHLTRIASSAGHKEPAQAREPWNAFVDKLAPALRERLLDDGGMIEWWVLIHAGSPSALTSALDRVPPAVLERHTQAVLSSLTQRESPQAKSGGTLDYEVAEQTWRIALRALPRPIDYRYLPHLAEHVPPSLWPELVASGYEVRDAWTALGCLLVKMSAPEMTAAWPAMKSHFPTIERDAPRLVLRAYLGHRLRGGRLCWGAVRDGRVTVEKLSALRALGLHGTVFGIDTRESVFPREIAAAAEPFLPSASQTGAIEPRIVNAAPACRLTLNDVWWRKLANNPVVHVDDGSVIVDMVQLIELPGEPACGLLVGGFQAVDAYVSGLIDTFTGPIDEPRPSCPDAPDRYEIWHERGGAIESIPADVGKNWGDPFLTSVLDKPTGRRMLLHTGDGQCRGMGSTSLPFALEWRREAGRRWALRRVTSPEIEHALFTQCAESDHTCRGLTLASTPYDTALEAGQPSEQDAFRGLTLADFLGVYAHAKRDAWFDAVMALDRARWRQLSASGVPGQWVAEALRRIGQSPLPLADKRRRTAMLFADRKQLEKGLASDVIDSLVDWMPREDWRPVLDVLSHHPSASCEPEPVVARALEKGSEALACEIERARNRICGMTCRAER
jgi:hypothetical protein